MVLKLAAAEVARLDPYKFMAVPRMSRAVPYLGHVLLTARKPGPPEPVERQ